ncbi:MAG: sigma-54 dependent transcriptional regulator [Calditrichia bacterium]
MNKGLIYIVDDEQTLAFFIQKHLEGQSYQVKTAADLNAARKILEAELPDILLLDLKLPDGDGLQFYQEIVKEKFETPTIMMTAHGLVQLAIEAIKKGVDDFIIKPFDMNQLQVMIEKVLEKNKLHNQLKYYRTTSDFKGKSKYFVSKNEKMQEIQQLALKIAQIPDATILIQGASGTGKEMLARFIHHNSPQAEKPFIEINCASIPENLLESELFGYEPGAFTDAKKRKIGLIELAGGGTLFLDEISEMNPGTQAKLLRFIETRSFKRLGGVRDIEVELRIIAATNQSLKKLVNDGTFRQDLYFRLNMFELTLPPLKDRKDEILVLAQFFLEQSADKLKKCVKTFSEETKQLIINYTWPGNLRELHNAIERAVILTDSDQILPKHLPFFTKSDTNAKKQLGIESMNNAPLPDFINEIEKKLVQDALKKTNYKQTEAAHLLKIPPHTIRYLLKKHNIKH